jgi:hypothetical protein
MRKISSQFPAHALRPARALCRERHVQYNLKPARCQPTTVSGWTMISVRFHPDQNRRSITQKTLSGGASLGRGCRACRTVSCCREAKISGSKSRREHKLQAIKPMNNLSIRSIHGLYQRRCRLTSVQIQFWRATGFEASGHRGSFLRSSEDSLTGTISLAPQVVDTVKIPVIAAGGIADARGIAAAFALGAEAVQMGTAFLACEESGASPLHRKAILSGNASRTVLTRGFTGRLARGSTTAYWKN